MKYILPIFLIFCLGKGLMGQVADEPEDGTVSFITSQNIYVKFKSTDNISLGDTLFILKEGNLTPAMVVTSKSSISCVCTPISSEPFSVSDKIIIKQKPKLKPSNVEQVKEEPVKDLSQKNEPDGNATKTGKIQEADIKSGPGTSAMKEKAKPQQDISGRLSISSYSNFSNTQGNNSQRMRYTFSINAKNLANSKLSGESYISFVHKDGEWNEIQDNIFNGLKIYNLSLNYEFNKYVKLLAGRKINPRLSNMGAIDGLQLEMKFKSFTAGILAGSRPDYEDYSLNSSLFQYGAFLSHDLVSKKGNMQSTLAYAEQKNNGATDRRFLYFQHSNSLVKNLYFFGTIEFDLYKYDTVNEKLQNALDLSNLYISLRYRVIRQLSFSVSYSSRQNIIYYETYKNILDQILDYEALQGFSFQVNYNPVKFLSVGLKTGYRYRKSDPRPTKNLYGYVTYSRIPLLKMSSTVSVTFLETGYVSGKIYSISFSKDLLKGKLFTSLGYRHVNYSYFNAESSEPQNMAEINFNWNIIKKLALSVNYEGTFTKENKFTRLYFNLTQRF